MADPVELVVERLIHGPEALARAPDGRIVFVEGGLPGEHLAGELHERRRDYARARLQRVLDPPGPSPARRAPPCPVVQQCGGCPWQHVEYAAQLRFREEVVLRELWRNGRVEPRVVLPPVAGPEWRWRNRIRLGVARRRGGTSVALGFRGRASHEIVAIEDCLVAHAALIAGLPLAHAMVRLVPPVVEIELLVDDRSELRFRAFLQAPAPIAPEVVLAELLREARGHDLRGAKLAGIAFEPSGAGAAWRALAGDTDQKLEVQPGLWLRAPLGVFTQVNLALNRALVAEVLHQVGDARAVTDLYAGCGNFSIPLARAGAEVHAIEGNVTAVRAGAESARQHGVDARCRFVASPVERALTPELLAGPRRVVVLDPPRSGAAQAADALARTRPDRVVYVSCDLASFARDAGRLVRAGLALEAIRVLDLTPQTYRAEVLGVFG